MSLNKAIILPLRGVSHLKITLVFVENEFSVYFLLERKGGNMTFNEYLIDKFGINEPIYAEEINYEDYSRPWILRELKKLVDNGELKRYERGIYYFPEKLPWGKDSTLSPRKIAMKRFVTDGDEVYGYITGLSLWNMSGLSTQVPNLLEVATNKESTRVRDIYIGYQRVRARKSRTEISKDNVRTLQLLDLMNVMQPPASLDGAESFMLKKFVKKVKEAGVTKDSISQYIGLYPAKAMKNLIESGVIYDFA